MRRLFCFSLILVLVILSGKPIFSQTISNSISIVPCRNVDRQGDNIYPRGESYFFNSGEDINLLVGFSRDFVLNNLGTFTTVNVSGRFDYYDEPHRVSSYNFLDLREGTPDYKAALNRQKKPIPEKVYVWLQVGTKTLRYNLRGECEITVRIKVDQAKIVEKLKNDKVTNARYPGGFLYRMSIRAANEPDYKTSLQITVQ